MKKNCFLTVLVCLLCVCLVLALAACKKNETSAGGDKTAEDTKTGGEENKTDQTEKPGGKTDRKDDAADDVFGDGELPVVPLP